MPEKEVRDKNSKEYRREVAERYASRYGGAIAARKFFRVQEE